MKRIYISGRTGWFWFWEEPLQGQDLVGCDIDLFTIFEARGDDALAHFDAKIDLIDRAKDLVDFTNWGFVL